MPNATGTVAPTPALDVAPVYAYDFSPLVALVAPPGPVPLTDSPVPCIRPLPERLGNCGCGEIISATLPKTKDAPTALSAVPTVVSVEIAPADNGPKTPNADAPNNPAPGKRNDAAIKPTPARSLPVVPSLPTITGTIYKSFDPSVKCNSLYSISAPDCITR